LGPPRSLEAQQRRSSGRVRPAPIPGRSEGRVPGASRRAFVDMACLTGRESCVRRAELTTPERMSEKLVQYDHVKSVRPIIRFRGVAAILCMYFGDKFLCQQ